MESSYDQVVEKLKKALPSNLHCPMCGRSKFEVIKGWASTQIQSSKVGFTIGGPAIPSLTVVCCRCGFISQHASDVLDHFEEKDEP